MVFKITLKDIRVANDIKYNESKFGNPPLAVGNVVWVKIFDEKGIFEMPVKIIEEIEVQTCLRCGHSWKPESTRLPKTCSNPKCRSPYWNKPRQVKGSETTEPR